MLAREGAGCAWPHSRRVKNAALMTAAVRASACRACHGARSREGLVLAVLAMLAPKRALRVAPGGSAPPIPSAARRVTAVVRPGRESRRLNRTGKLT